MKQRSGRPYGLPLLCLSKKSWALRYRIHWLVA